MKTQEIKPQPGHRFHVTLCHNAATCRQATTCVPWPWRLSAARFLLVSRQSGGVRGRAAAAWLPELAAVRRLGGPSTPRASRATRAPSPNPPPSDSGGADPPEAGLHPAYVQALRASSTPWLSTSGEDTAPAAHPPVSACLHNLAFLSSIRSAVNS